MIRHDPTYLARGALVSMSRLAVVNRQLVFGLPSIRYFGQNKVAQRQFMRTPLSVLRVPLGPKADLSAPLRANAERRPYYPRPMI